MSSSWSIDRAAAPSGLFFKATAPTDTYTLSLHDALPIFERSERRRFRDLADFARRRVLALGQPRSEEHTSELQSRRDLVCRLLLEKKITDEVHLLGLGDRPRATEHIGLFVLSVAGQCLDGHRRDVVLVEHRPGSRAVGPFF